MQQDSQAHVAFSMIPQDSKAQRFLMVRGKAIQLYADYEQSLAGLYAFLMGVSPDIAGVTFFRINNARARISILERLMQKRFESKHSIFWNSLVKTLLQPLDAKRNEIVHWATQVLIEFDGSGGQVDAMCLSPPNFWDRRSTTPQLFEQDVCNFMVMCDFAMRLVNTFTLAIKDGHEGVPETWREICRKPVVYPPPDTHPLARRP